MTERVNEGKLSISTSLHALLEQEIAPDLNLDTAKFWQDFQKIAEKYIPINENLLKKREELQTKIDEWHLSCLLYTSPSPRDVKRSRMPSSA